MPEVQKEGHYTQHITRVELDDNRTPAGAYAHNDVRGGHTVTKVRISTTEAHDHISYHKDANERIYAVPYKGLPHHYGSSEDLADGEQTSGDSGLSVHIGRSLPPGPKAPATATTS